ncbi:MAG: spermine synthase [Anaerolineae bacterium]|nr:spermine synthase [Anaerolineae bacterium]NIN95147.1 spermine synthase [Anaerolineae bacterium]NIQ78999.1 spermine synthase [Anaerolineae bacterium]
MPPARTTPRKDYFLLPIVFISGMTILAVEMSAARLLSPYFGDSQLIWANLIGLMMIYLAAGYYLGGRLADWHPHGELLYQLTAWAGFTIGLIPFLSRPVLHYSASGFERYSVGIIVGSFLGILFLFTVPVVLLGCVSPFAVRLQSRSVASTGHTAGTIYALSTLGSILGAFLPTLLLIPRVGTRTTFLLSSLILLAVSVASLFWTVGSRAVLYLLLPLLIILLHLLFPSGLVKDTNGLVYEAESAYNYIQVADQDSRRVLMLNEGQATHSVYWPGRVLSGGVWDYFLLAPYFTSLPSPEDVDSLCIIGLAAGTAAKEYTTIYGPMLIDGVELDPEIVEVGRRFFAMNEPNLNVAVQDGRYFLAQSDSKYDIIITDAFRQPYIPFHLATKEFFGLAREHLNPGGVLVANVGRTASDFRLVEVMATTMDQVFETVFILDVPGDSNSLVIGTQEATSLESIHASLETVSNSWLYEVAERSKGRIRAFHGEGLVLTDDRAPVEHLTHLMILRYLLEGE